ncbi:MAG: hypothetical protein A3H96_05335 [Acidobacteria bacterium RIFCSPLOWO2_02_FULL_67_36]|nr:MAG: hypothetical protein A3H96_05335 [Acidobacteria bacterium RIFCSPLOWO2_02_FULL_67_36]OFW21664.1 MAG: hypothetical protein A3G21_14815 [Acidobacteria bacterium RIFCSPLOWO2_12_FULL_66_21]
MTTPRVAPVVVLLLLAVPSAPAARQRPSARLATTARVTIDDLVRRGSGRSATPTSCSDAVFLRRAYLDVIGTLPTAEEARAFLTDRQADKRRALIDRLLERDEYADYWAMKWSDLLRVKSEFPINLWPNAVQAYHRWIRASIRDGVPYDRFARELLTESGSNFRVPQVNFYRAVQGRDPAVVGRAVALTFMGTRAEQWPKERLAGMAVFFSRIGYKATGEWKEEIVFFDEATPAAARSATFPDGTVVRLPADRDPREVFAGWLTAPGNPWFARSVSNRVWSWLMGHGIIHEPDDIRADNPPANTELLSYLERELIASHYDLKHLYRLILNSGTYQQATESAADAAAAEYSRYTLRPLDAEVLIDALCQITGTTEQYSSAIPEPFTFMPQEQRAIALADGSITSTFLETFGRSPRDTGLEAERTPKPTASGRLSLLNSSLIQRKIEQGPALQALLGRGDVRQVVTGLYLTILSRFPTDDELKMATEYGRARMEAAPAPAAAAEAGRPPRPGANRRGAVVDLAWALINSAEFQYRH